jgi:HNH endonuclease
MSKFYDFRHRTFWVKEDGRIFNEDDILMRNFTEEGYLSIKMKFFENGKIEHVCLLQHRIVAEVFVPNPDEKPYVIHLDGDKANNKTENLAWATHKERYKHQFDLGLFKTPKLSKSDVLEIKESLKNKVPKNFIASQYGVSHTQIKRIDIGENWSNAV